MRGKAGSRICDLYHYIVTGDTLLSDVAFELTILATKDTIFALGRFLANN